MRRFLVFVCVLASVCGVSASSLTLEDLFVTGGESDIRISPKGDTVWFVASSVSSHYDKSCDDWLYSAFSSMDEFKFFFNIKKSTVKSGQRYTLKDMDAEFTYGIVGGGYVIPVECSFVMTLSEDGMTSIEAMMLGMDSIVYNLTYQEAAVPSQYNDVDLVFNVADLRDATRQGAFQFVGDNDEYSFALAVKSTHIPGGYIPEYVLSKGFTFATTGGKNIRLVRIANIKVDKVSGADNYSCHADFYSYDGNCYHVTFNHIRPNTREAVVLSSSDVSVNVETFASKGYSTVSADKDNYHVEIDILTEGGVGNYSMRNDSLRDVRIYQRVSSDSLVLIRLYDKGVINLTTIDNGWLYISGDILSRDGVLYCLDLLCLNPPTFVDTIILRSEKKRKMMKGGRMLILDDGHTYNAAGQEIPYVYY